MCTSLIRSYFLGSQAQRNGSGNPSPPEPPRGAVNLREENHKLPQAQRNGSGNPSPPEPPRGAVNLREENHKLPAPPPAADFGTTSDPRMGNCQEDCI
ncbi:hypothetical protein QE152_g15485 [Popillia japonica]|uniref:Uncharacterized protein n=1 Tax=Popillia japonica TaxID=7064 RepID=A0AAW1L5F1_POPJA